MLKYRIKEVWNIEYCAFYSYVLVCHSYVTQMYSHVIRIYSYVIRMSLFCSSISFVCRSKQIFICLKKFTFHSYRLHEILQLAQNIDITQNCVLIQKDEYVVVPWQVLITATKLHSSLNLESAQVRVLLSKCQGLAMVTISGNGPHWKLSAGSVL